MIHHIIIKQTLLMGITLVETTIKSSAKGYKLYADLLENLKTLIDNESDIRAEDKLSISNAYEQFIPQIGVLNKKIEVAVSELNDLKNTVSSVYNSYMFLMLVFYVVSIVYALFALFIAITMVAYSDHSTQRLLRIGILSSFPCCILLLKYAVIHIYGLQRHLLDKSGSKDSTVSSFLIIFYASEFVLILALAIDAFFWVSDVQNIDYEPRIYVLTITLALSVFFRSSVKKSLSPLMEELIGKVKGFMESFDILVAEINDLRKEAHKLPPLKISEEFMTKYHQPLDEYKKQLNLIKERNTSFYNEWLKESDSLILRILKRIQSNLPARLSDEIKDYEKRGWELLSQTNPEHPDFWQPPDKE